MSLTDGFFFFCFAKWQIELIEKEGENKGLKHPQSQRQQGETETEQEKDYNPVIPKNTKIG